MGQHAKLYRSKRWQKLRAWHLSKQPLCVMCKAAGKLTAATVVDHVTPHKGDAALFLAPTNLQSLCKPHHDSDKQRQEWLDAQRPIVDDDGYRLDGSW